MSARARTRISNAPPAPLGNSRLARIRVRDDALRLNLTDHLNRLGFDIQVESSGVERACALIVEDQVSWSDARDSPDDGLCAHILIASSADSAAGGETADEVLILPADFAQLEARIALAFRRAEARRPRADYPGGKRYREVLGSAVRQARELQLLHEVRTAIGQDLELPAVFRRVVEATAEAFGFTHVSVYLLEDGQWLVLQHQVGYDSVLDRISVERGVAGRVARSGRPILLEDVASDPAFLGAIDGIVSEVCVPFFDDERVAGIFNVESTAGHRLGADDLRVMTAVAEHLGLAVGRARHYESARASETRLRLALDSAEMGTWDWDTVSGEVSWSEQMGPLYGLPRGTPRLTGTEWYTLVHPSDQDMVRRADANTLAYGTDYDVEFRVIHPHTGDVRWLAGKGRAVERDERGGATRLIGVTMDITGRKRLEDERLRLVQLEAARAEAEEAQRRITDTLERITAAFIAIDPEGRLTYLNARAGEMLRLPPVESIGRDFWEVFAVAAGTGFAAQLQRAAVSQEAVEFDSLSPTLNRWLEVHAYPAPEGLSIYLQDVTERRQAEEELRRSEERFRSLVQNASDVIVIVDRRGVVRYASPAMERIIGEPPMSIVGHDNLFRAHPDDVGRLRRAFIQSARTPGVLAPIELRFRHRDGSWRWLEVTATNLFDEPGIDGIVANCRDVTERKKVEDDLRFLAETSELLAGSLDTETTLSTLVRQVVSHLADWCVVDVVAEDGTVRGLAVAHVDPELEKRLLAMRQRRPIDPRAPTGPGYSLRTGKSRLYPVMDDGEQAQHVDSPTAREEFRAFGFRSGICVPLIARGATIGVMSFASGTPGRFGLSELALAEDLARRAALAMDNARLYRDSQSAITARDQFLSVAAHELRTPITSINGFSELLRRELLGAGDAVRIARFVDRLSGSGARLAALVEDMLDVSRIRLGQLPLRLAPFELVALVQRVVLSYEEQNGEARHSFALFLPSEPCTVVADEDRLEQVLTNLLDNAVKYTPHGGEIRLTLETRSDAVLLTVADTGIGLPPEELESIFKPFGRAENAIADNLPGLGLGLFICRNIVERHGGRIWAESAGEGHGTTMVVWLPVSDGGTG